MAKTKTKSKAKPAKSEEPKRPKTVPAAAVYNAENEQWELGKKDGKGKRVGEWKYWWKTTGHHCGTSFFENGGKKETRKRFHTDGTISHEGILLNGQIMPNTTYVLQRSRNETTELAMQIPEYKKVFRMEQLFIRKGESRWKNFNEKGQRIDLEGHLLLTPEKYATNFPGFTLPRALVELVEFQAVFGEENYSECFAIGADSKSFLKIWSKNREFLECLMPIGAANGTGSSYCFWNDKPGRKSQKLEDMPVVVFGDEGGVHVVAQNVSELLEILSYDVEASVSHDGVDYTRFDYEPRPAIKQYRVWLKDVCGIDKPRKPDAIVRAAQAKYKKPFDAWMAKYVKPE